ncbi:MAG: hypothetical protein FWG99_10010 [Treponema sp.]|nr:hypothetical protein [Treponema sp.]
MKNMLKVLGIIAVAAVIGFSLVSCSSGGGGGGSGGIPSKWRGTYSGGGTTFTISGSSGSYTNFGALGSGTVSDLSVEEGGAVLAGSDTVGEWVYLLAEGERFGFIYNYSYGGNSGTIIALGGSASNIRNQAISQGGTFLPDIQISTIITQFQDNGSTINFGFDGEKTSTSTNTGGNSGGNGKTLVITGVSQNQMDQIAYGGYVILFPTSVSDANAKTDIGNYFEYGFTQYAVAGMDLYETEEPVKVGNTYTVTVPLYKADMSGPWTGSGNHNVWNIFIGEENVYLYKASNVNFSSATTTIAATRYILVETIKMDDYGGGASGPNQEYPYNYNYPEYW